MEEIFDFFVREGLGFPIHAALPTLPRSSAAQYCHSEARRAEESLSRGAETLRRFAAQGDTSASDVWPLSPQAHGQLLLDMLDRYLANLDKIRISTLDSMCRSISARHGGICTFGDCLGEYLAVAPDGEIYSCQRFIGMTEYRLGNVHDCPTIETLAQAPAWHMFKARQDRIAEECGDCAHLNFCRGGCPYNALVASAGRFDGTLRDPHCPAYKQVFAAITDRALTEVFSAENLEAVVSQGPSKYGLMRKGKLLRLMRGGPHPQQVTQQARKLAAAAALAVSDSPADAVQKLERAGLVTDHTRALGSLTALRNELDHQSQGLVNAYLHVTYACNLTCDHCYASPVGQVANLSYLKPDDIARLVREIAQAGFRKAVITGGEPMAHPRRDEVLDALAALRGEIKPTQVVLRTNLAYPLNAALMERMAHSADQIVVSVDGNETCHNARRGLGAYARTVANLGADRDPSSFGKPEESLPGCARRHAHGTTNRRPGRRRSARIGPEIGCVGAFQARFAFGPRLGHAAAA